MKCNFSSLLTFYVYVNDCKKILSFVFFFLIIFYIFITFLFSLELTRRSFTSAHHILGSLSFLILNNILFNRTHTEKRRNSIDRFLLFFFFFFLILQLFYIVLHRIESFYFLKEYNKQP